MWQLIYCSDCKGIIWLQFQHQDGASDKSTQANPFRRSSGWYQTFSFQFPSKQFELIWWSGSVQNLRKVSDFHTDWKRCATSSGKWSKWYKTGNISLFFYCSVVLAAETPGTGNLLKKQTVLFLHTLLDLRFREGIMTGTAFPQHLLKAKQCQS